MKQARLSSIPSKEKVYMEAVQNQAPEKKCAALSEIMSKKNT